MEFDLWSFILGLAASVYPTARRNFDKIRPLNFTRFDLMIIG